MFGSTSEKVIVEAIEILDSCEFKVSARPWPYQGPGSSNYKMPEARIYRVVAK